MTPEETSWEEELRLFAEENCAGVEPFDENVERVVRKWSPFIHKLRSEWQRVSLSLLEDANYRLRSCFQVVQRKGKATNWEALEAVLTEELEKEHDIIQALKNSLDK